MVRDCPILENQADAHAFEIGGLNPATENMDDQGFVLIRGQHFFKPPRDLHDSSLVAIMTSSIVVSCSRTQRMPSCRSNTIPWLIALFLICSEELRDKIICRTSSLMTSNSKIA